MKSDLINKTYCILTPRIAGMGGAQLYVLRRMNFLKNKGICPILLISDTPDSPLKDRFGSFEIIQFPELGFPVFHYSRKKLNTILSLLKDKLNIYGQDLVIESHTLNISIWGELLAERLKCKHIIYPLNERPITYWEFKPVIDFFLWKQNRIEFIGPSAFSLRVVLGKYYSIDKAYYSNIGFDPEELSDKSTPDISDLMDKNSFRIGTISRLSKPYIEELIKSAIRLAYKYPERKITMIIAGNDPDSSILEKFRNKYGQTGNLKFKFPGYINPLGRDFFHNLDVFVGMGTAAINSISSHCATITVDPITKKSSGFFGLTSKDTMFADVDLLSPLDYWIEIALTDPLMLGNASKAGYEIFRRDYLADACMQKIEDLITASDGSKAYWRFSENYLSSRFLKCYYHAENSTFYKLLQTIYSLRNLSKWR